MSHEEPVVDRGPTVSELVHGTCVVQEASLKHPAVRLHYVEQGAGAGRPLVILLHGFPEFWYAWRNYLPALAGAGYHAVAPDLRGYNESDKPIGLKNYHMEKLTQDVIRLIQHFSHSHAIVVGHDWGGAIAWELAEQQPRIVSKLVVMNAPHRGAYARNMRRNPVFAIRQSLRFWYIYFFQLPILPELALRAGNFRWVEQAFRGWAIRRDTFSDENLKQYKSALAQPGALRAALNYYRAAARSRYGLGVFTSTIGFTKFKKIQSPTLLVWGMNDKPLHPAIVNGVEEFIDAPFEKVEVPNCSHWVHLEQTELVLEHMLRFLE